MIKWLKTFAITVGICVCIVAVFWQRFYMYGALWYFSHADCVAGPCAGEIEVLDLPPMVQGGVDDIVYKDVVYSLPFIVSSTSVKESLMVIEGQNGQRVLLPNQPMLPIPGSLPAGFLTELPRVDVDIDELNQKLSQSYSQYELLGQMLNTHTENVRYFASFESLAIQLNYVVIRSILSPVQVYSFENETWKGYISMIGPKLGTIYMFSATGDKVIEISTSGLTVAELTEIVIAM